MTDPADVVFAEGFVRSECRDGSRLQRAMCDVFEMGDGLIRRLIRCLVPLAS